LLYIVYRKLLARYVIRDTWIGRMETNDSSKSSLQQCQINPCQANWSSILQPSNVIKNGSIFEMLQKKLLVDTKIWFNEIFLISRTVIQLSEHFFFFFQINFIHPRIWYTELYIYLRSESRENKYRLRAVARYIAIHCPIY